MINTEQPANVEEEAALEETLTGIRHTTEALLKTGEYKSVIPLVRAMDTYLLNDGDLGLWPTYQKLEAVRQHIVIPCLSFRSSRRRIWDEASGDEASGDGASRDEAELTYCDSFGELRQSFSLKSQHESQEKYLTRILNNAHKQQQAPHGSLAIYFGKIHPGETGLDQKSTSFFRGWKEDKTEEKYALQHGDITLFFSASYEFNGSCGGGSEHYFYLITTLLAHQPDYATMGRTFQYLGFRFGRCKLEERDFELRNEPIPAKFKVTDLDKERVLAGAEIALEDRILAEREEQARMRKELRYQRRK